MSMYSLPLRTYIISLKIVLSFITVGMIFWSEIFAQTLLRQGTYYADGFQGKRTANGDLFSQNNFSAAICDVPLGQYLYVSRWSTGVVVEANDRTNCNRYPNAIDLSSRAFQLFAPLSAWKISELQVTPIGSPGMNTSKSTLSKNVFAHLSIELYEDIPTVLFTGDSIQIRGKVTKPSEYALVYISSKDGTIVDSRLTRVSKDMTFMSFLNLPKVPGEYVFIVSQGKEFNTDKYATLFLIDRDALSYPSFPIARMKINPKIENIYDTPSIVLPEGITWDIRIKQWNAIHKVSGNIFTFQDVGLSSGVATVQISGYKLSTSSPLDSVIRYPNLFTGTVILDRKREVEGAEYLTLRTKNDIANFRIKIPLSPKVRSNYYITFPNGSVSEYTSPREYIDVWWYIIPNSQIPISIPMTEDGAYKLELVRDDGTALINFPFFRSRVWPILESITDNERKTLRMKQDEVRKENLERLNSIRIPLGKSLLTLDPTLTLLAQAKVDDMITRKYQAHADPDGLYIDGLAKKIWLDLRGSIWENIGYGTISDIALQDGLEESGVHKHNMLRSNWKKVGIWYWVKDGKVYLVQVFGD